VSRRRAKPSESQLALAFAHTSAAAEHRALAERAAPGFNLPGGTPDRKGPDAAEAAIADVAPTCASPSSPSAELDAEGEAADGPRVPKGWTFGESVVTDEHGVTHPKGPFVADAAKDLRRSAARQRVQHTRASMVAAAEWIERWESVFPRIEGT